MKAARKEDLRKKNHNQDAAVYPIDIITLSRQFPLSFRFIVDVIRPCSRRRWEANLFKLGEDGKKKKSEEEVDSRSFFFAGLVVVVVEEEESWKRKRFGWSNETALDHKKSEQKQHKNKWKLPPRKANRKKKGLRMLLLLFFFLRD